MNKIAKLMPCPFCGSDDLELYPDGDMEGHCIIGDHQDGCPFEASSNETEGDAISNWNTRTNPDPTHYAVMDSDHIVHAVPAEGLEDGKLRCERFINSIGADLPEAKDWTVKGVTVHE